MKTWTAQTIGDYVGILEFKDVSVGEFHVFEVCWNADKTALVFGGATNAGFLQSGYMTLEDGESEYEALSGLYEELGCFYASSKHHAPRLVCNERM